MTAGMLDSSSIGVWYPGRPGLQVTIAPKAEEHQTTTSFTQESAYARRAATLQKIVGAAQRTPQLQPHALVRLVTWLSSIPLEVPEPFIAAGDDGSISSEWDVAGNSLHVTFFDDTDEVYFFSPGGEEWEGTLDATDKLSEAMRTIAQVVRR